MHGNVWRSCFQESSRQTPIRIFALERTDQSGLPGDGPDRDGCTGAPVWLGKGAAIFTRFLLWDGVMGSLALRACDGWV